MIPPSLDDVLAELNQIRRELNDIQRKLSGLPDDAFTERVTLRDRRRELHTRVGELRDARQTPQEIQKELQDLRRVQNDIFDRHLSVGNIGPGGGEGGGGIEIRYVHEVNRTIDEAWDRAKIDRRINELEAKLARLQE